MDCLPGELMPMLFEHLDLGELLKCRLVNKRFRFHVDQTRIEELVVASTRPADLKKSRFLTKEMIDIEKSAICLNAFNGYRHVFNLNRYLKRLCLSFHDKLPLNMAIFDQMRIEQLDLKCDHLESNQAVELPLLKNLELMIGSDEFDLFVRAPKLAKMKTNCLDSVYVDSPDALLYLETDWSEDVCTQFKNLQVLRCCFLYREVLADFTSLKSLEIYNPSSEGEWEQTERTHHRDTLKYLVKQGKVLKRPDVKLFYCGVPIVNGLELEDLPESLELQVRNFDRLTGDLSFVTELDYSKLTAAILSNGLNERPASFLTTFYNVQRVTTSGRVNQKDFFEFLKQAPYLTDLELVNSSLRGSLISLPEFCNLTRLIVKEDLYMSVKFDFILKFKRLRYFESAVQCSDSFFSLAIVSFQKLAGLSSFEFKKSDQTTVQITKNDKRYSFHSYAQGRPSTYEHGLQLQKLVELCIKQKHGDKLNNGSWANEIIRLAKFYKSGTD